MSLPKFTFIPEYQLEAEEKKKCHKATITNKGALYLSESFCYEYQLNGKFVQFYQLKTQSEVGVGWRIIEGDSLLEILDKCRKIIVNKSGGTLISLNKILKSIGKLGQKHKRLDIQHHKPLFGQNKGQEYWYVILNEVRDERTNTESN